MNVCPNCNSSNVEYYIAGLCMRCAGEELARLEIENKQLKADLDKLKEYVVHKEGCPARRMYYIRECPRCGSRKNHWQGGGPAFDAYRVCEECDGPAYIPEERLGECSCGLDQALTDNKPDGKDK